MSVVDDSCQYCLSYHQLHTVRNVTHKSVNNEKNNRNLFNMSVLFAYFINWVYWQMLLSMGRAFDEIQIVIVSCEKSPKHSQYHFAVRFKHFNNMFMIALSNENKTKLTLMIGLLPAH